MTGKWMKLVTATAPTVVMAVGEATVTAVTMTDVDATVEIATTTVDHADPDHPLQDSAEDLTSTEEDRHHQEKPTRTFHRQAIAPEVADVVTDVTARLLLHGMTSEDATIRTVTSSAAETVHHTPENSYHLGAIIEGTQVRLHREGLSTGTASARTRLLQVVSIVEMYRAVTTTRHHAAKRPLQHLKSPTRLLIVSRTNHLLECRV